MKKIIMVIALATFVLCGCNKSKKKDISVPATETQTTLDEKSDEAIFKRINEAILRRREEDRKHQPVLDLLSVITNTQYDVELNKDVITDIDYFFKDKNPSVFHEVEVHISDETSRSYLHNKYVTINLLGDFLLAKTAGHDHHLVTPKVVIYDEFGNIVNSGRAVMRIFSVFKMYDSAVIEDTYRDSRYDEKRLSDGISTTNIIRALAKNGYKVKIEILKRDNELLHDITLNGNSKLSNLKMFKVEQERLEQEQATAEQEKRERAKQEAKEKQEKEEQIRLAWEEKEKKMKPIRALEKKIESTNKMIDIATKNGYNRAAKKYKEDLKKLEEKLEKMQREVLD